MDRSKLKKIMIYTFFFTTSIFAYSHAAIVPTEEQKAIFNAAGFKNENGTWRGKCSIGHISVFKDLNGDGRPDAVIRDGGTTCYASIGVGFHLMTKQANDQWTRIFHSPGEASFLKTTGRHGWPDLIAVNASQCHTVYRWDGRKFIKNRQSYKGKLCGSF